MQSMDFLQNYPYGCLEQKTSVVTPMLVLKQLYTKLNEAYDLKKLKIERREDSNEGNVKVSRDQVIQEYIAELPNFQNRDGGMSYWADRKDKDPSDLWVTSYLLSTISDLQVLGYKVSEKMISNMRAYMESERYRNIRPYCVGTNCEYDLSTRIAVIDALARQSTNEYTAYKMRTLLQEKSKKELQNSPDLLLPQSLMLAHLSKNTNLSAGERDTLLSDAKKNIQQVQNDDLVVNPREAYIGKSSSDNRVQQTAQMIQTIFLLDKSYATQQEQTTDLMIKWLLGQKKQGGFGSTIDTVTVIRSLVTYLEFSPVPETKRIAKLVLNDAVIKEETIKAKDKFTTYTKILKFSDLKQENTFALQV